MISETSLEMEGQIGVVPFTSCLLCGQSGSLGGPIQSLDSELAGGELDKSWTAYVDWHYAEGSWAGCHAHLSSPGRIDVCISLWGSLHRSEKLFDGWVSGWPQEVHILLRHAHQAAVRNVKAHTMDAAHAAHLGAHVAGSEGR